MQANFDNLCSVLAVSSSHVTYELGKAWSHASRLRVCATLQVLDLLEDACEGLVSHIESSKFATES